MSLTLERLEEGEKLIRSHLFWGTDSTREQAVLWLEENCATLFKMAKASLEKQVLAKCQNGIYWVQIFPNGLKLTFDTPAQSYDPKAGYWVKTQIVHGEELNALLPVHTSENASQPANCCGNCRHYLKLPIPNDPRFACLRDGLIFWQDRLCGNHERKPDAINT